MSIMFSAIAHQTRQQLAGTTMPLGHVHQLIAAIVGYQSYAGYQAASSGGIECASFDEVRYIVPDSNLLLNRAAELGYGQKQVKEFATSFARALRQDLPEARLHEYSEDLLDDIRFEVEGDIANSGEFSSVQAETNAGMAEFELEFEQLDEVIAESPEWVVDVSGTASLEVDTERPYAGSELDVSARLIFPKLGRRCLGNHRIEDISASMVDW